MASGSNNPPASTSDILSNLLGAVDEQTIKAYRAKHVAPVIWRAAPDHFSVQNARNWIQLQPFLEFVAKIAQQPEPRTPKHSRPLPDSSSPDIVMVGGPSECVDLDYSNPEHPSKRHQKERYDAIPFPSSPTPHSANINILEASAGLFIPEESTKSKKKNRSGKRITQTAKHLAANRIQISRKVWVDNILPIIELKETWPIPNDGKSYAYIVDLTGSTMVFQDSKGEPLSMANIIKNAMAGKAVQAVTRTDPQRSLLSAEQRVSLWEGYERWEHDFEPFRELFQCDMDNNAAEHETPLGYAVSMKLAVITVIAMGMPFYEDSNRPPPKAKIISSDAQLGSLRTETQANIYSG
ncbi:hypothetical protein M422DRAFT_274997 [Sphaerobolus stellatus SS14]|uniref:Uncharacterized protein n=1 Tax=Sphaerobolus stellatus (strain SS14) TaxID=990650 RepID=A0A0C9T5S5_SPHS4|nr:hypothetical protein M422DRAFT_274997 [Sphaerobolus stellatus SS14]